MTDKIFDAVIFDLDGVITNTASLHSIAWKQMFDEFLKAHAEENGTPFQEFTHEGDYLPYVDGKPRYKGVASFLESRGIELPYGNPNDPPGQTTICALGNTKNETYNQFISDQGAEIYTSTVDLIHTLKEHGYSLGVASSSKNTGRILEVTGLISLMETCVDGLVSAELGLAGKPQPDIFTTACDNLGGHYDRSVVVEDAISGVQAGKKGGFGLVIGVAREDNAQELKNNGADIVVRDMAEISLERIEEWFAKDLENKKWGLEYSNYVPAKEGVREALLTVGNGYFGTRGALEETSANDTNYPGTYIAGLYNRLPSQVGGRTVYNEDFVNAPNWLPLTFRVGDGDWFNPNQAEILHFTRRLDFRDGVLHRKLVVRDKAGRETQVTSQRFASMADPHLAALRYTITPLNYTQTITIRSGLDGTIINAGVNRYRDLNSKHLEAIEEGGDGNTIYLRMKTTQSKIEIAEASRLTVILNGETLPAEGEVATKPGAVFSSLTVNAAAGQTITVEKIVAIHTTHAQEPETPSPLGAARHKLENAPNFEQILQASTAAWGTIWKKIDIQITGDRLAQQLLRLHLFHMLVTASPHNVNLDTGIPARGLHGEAYRGHVFWDELYIMPFYDIHLPETARSVLMYRYRRLNEARKYAQAHGYKGAMFPWQSGSTGREETQELHLNPVSGKWGEDYSTLQRHIALAIAYNVWQYVWLTEDLNFLEAYGAELFLEICRFWASKAIFDENTGRFSIPKVMGPDEFHEKYPHAQEGGLQDNAYTNLMTAWVFRRAFDLLNMLPEKAKESVRAKINLSEDELAHWQKIAARLNVPLSEDGVLEQYKGYFELKELDWDFYREKYGNIHRLDRILKAEGKSPDEYKVAKQADALMIFYTLSPKEVVELLRQLGHTPPDDLLARNFQYYLKRTSHGSTLSRLVHGYLANLIGERELGWKLYLQALTSDYQDIQGGTTKEGIHAGVMAGTVLFALRAYGGVNWDGGRLRLDPWLPATWREMKFNLNFKGARYFFIIGVESVSVKVEGETPRSVVVRGDEVKLEPGIWTEVNY